MTEKATTEELLEKLTGKEHAFVLAYLANNFNGTQAALEAYETESPATAAVIASQTLRRPAVRAAIAAYFEEAALSADEALARLSTIARGSIEDFLAFGGEDPEFEVPASVRVSLDRARALGVLHLIREIKHTREAVHSRDYDKTTTTDRYEIKLYDAQSALETILRVHGRLTNRHEHTGKDGQPIEVLAIDVVAPEDARA